MTVWCASFQNFDTSCAGVSTSSRQEQIMRPSHHCTSLQRHILLKVLSISLHPLELLSLEVISLFSEFSKQLCHVTSTDSLRCSKQIMLINNMSIQRCAGLYIKINGNKLLLKDHQRIFILFSFESCKNDPSNITN